MNSKSVVKFIGSLSILAIIKSEGRIYKVNKDNLNKAAMCSMGDPRRVFEVRYKPECVLSCQGDASCVGVNWKDPDTCQLYYSNPKTWKSEPGCTYFGQEIIPSPCDSNPCQNDGTCHDGVTGYNCSCRLGVNGTRCESVWPVLILRQDLAGFHAFFFNRSWAEFRQEFGSPTSQYWYGLDRLHELTQRKCVARYDLQLTDGTWRFAQYSTFSVDNSSTKYRLTLGGYSGNAGDSLASQNGRPFSTYDVKAGVNDCAGSVGGGCWYSTSCSYVYITASATKYTLFNWWSAPNWIQLNVVETHLVCL